MVEMPLDADISFVKTPDGLCIKQLYFPYPGIFMGQHAHEFSHSHLVGNGEIRVWVEGVKNGDFKAGELIFIESGKRHMMMSLKSETRGFCISSVSVNAVTKESHFPK